MAKYSFSKGSEKRLMPEGWYYCAIVYGKTYSGRVERWFLRFAVLFSPAGQEFVGQQFADSIFWSEREWRIDSLMKAAFPEKVGSDEEIEVVAEDLEGKEMWVKVRHREFEGEKLVAFSSFRPKDKPPREFAEAFSRFLEERREQEREAKEDEDPTEDL